jgi:hypothetical protein
MWLSRLNSYRLKQQRNGDVMRVRDKGDRHPGTDGLILHPDLPDMLCETVREDESTRDRHYEGQPDR